MKRLVTVAKDGLLRLPEGWLMIGKRYDLDYHDTGLAILNNGVHLCRVHNVRTEKYSYKYPVIRTKLKAGKYVAEIRTGLISIERWQGE